MRVRLTSPAAAELGDAADYFAGVDEVLAGSFLHAVEVAIDRIVMFSRGATPVEGFPGVRRARTRKFPHGVFYRHTAEEIVVLAVRHSSRETDVSED